MQSSLLRFNFAGHEFPRGYTVSKHTPVRPVGSRQRFLAENPQLWGEAGEGPACSWEAKGKVSAIFFSRVGTPLFEDTR